VLGHMIHLVKQGRVATGDDTPGIGSAYELRETV